MQRSTTSHLENKKKSFSVGGRWLEGRSLHTTRSVAHIFVGVVFNVLSHLYGFNFVGLRRHSAYENNLKGEYLISSKILKSRCMPISMSEIRCRVDTSLLKKQKRHEYNISC